MNQLSLILLMHSFVVNIRIYQPKNVMSTKVNASIFLLYDFLGCILRTKIGCGQVDMTFVKAARQLKWYGILDTRFSHTRSPN